MITYKNFQLEFINAHQLTCKHGHNIDVETIKSIIGNLLEREEINNAFLPCLSIKGQKNLGNKLGHEF